MKWWKKLMRDITKPEVSKKLKEWRKKYDDALAQYTDVLDSMDRYENLYNGDRHVNKNQNKGEGYASELAINVRNITFDLVESEVDSAIPYPKVTPIHEEDKEKAKIIEAYIVSEIEKQHLKEKNDVKERITPVIGASFDSLAWDSTIKSHCVVGDISVTGLHPKQVIPQEGVTELDKMDYYFIRTKETKDYIKRRWGVDVSKEEASVSDDEKVTENIVDLISVYYRNKDGGIGLFRWCGDVDVEDLDDYEARYIKRCKKCGETVTDDECKCGSKDFEKVKEEMDHVSIPQIKYVTSITGESVPALDEYGQPIVELVEIELPYYRPNCFPLVLRKNISKHGSFLGFSDVAAIEDQQDTIKKLGSKINEKLLKAGSILTLPRDLKIETTDREFKLLRVDNAQQIAMITVQTCQADVSKDMAFLETNYQWAKSALGITDAYQGKYDSSATSGAAKQYSINQAAGRLESKRIMKNEAYANLYEKMFKFALSYADQPIPITLSGKDGELEFSHFDKADFVKQDSSGEWYWNDEFIFTIDTTSTLLTNREAMWNQADLKLQSQAFGPLGDLRTMRLYWLEQERNGYPHAGEVLKEVERMLQEQNEQQALMAQMPQEGVPNEMPNM